MVRPALSPDPFLLIWRSLGYCHIRQICVPVLEMASGASIYHGADPQTNPGPPRTTHHVTNALRATADSLSGAVSLLTVIYLCMPCIYHLSIDIFAIEVDDAQPAPKAVIAVRFVPAFDSLQDDRLASY